MDTHTRVDPGASFLVDGGGPALPAWVAEECNRISGQELTEGDGRNVADLDREAKVREFEAWGQFKVSPPEKLGAQSKALVGTCWVLTWVGQTTANARWVGPGAAYGQCGNCGVCKSQIILFAADIPRSLEEMPFHRRMAVTYPGYQECLSPGGWL